MTTLSGHEKQYRFRNRPMKHITDDQLWWFSLSIRTLDYLEVVPLSARWAREMHIPESDQIRRLTDLKEAVTGSGADGPVYYSVTAMRDDPDRFFYHYCFYLVANGTHEQSKKLIEPVFDSRIVTDFEAEEGETIAQEALIPLEHPHFDLLVVSTRIRGRLSAPVNIFGHS